jgi:CheY-like chemotaxis protein
MIEVIRGARIRAGTLQTSRSGSVSSVASNVVSFGQQPMMPVERALPAVAPAAMPARDIAPVLPGDVLVAEDNEVNRIVFSQILDATGMSYRIVANGVEAVEAWRQARPLIILMDVSMPVMNGLQATMEIRRLEDETGEHVPIVGVTSHALDGDREMCLSSGMDDYITKPISPERLEEKIKRWTGLEDADLAGSSTS